LRIGAVDGVDVHERSVALATMRVAGGPGHLIARPKLAATHLRGRDVDVVRPLLEARQPHEPEPLGGDLEDAADLLGRLFALGVVALGLVPVALVRLGAQPLPLAAATPAAPPGSLTGSALARRARAPRSRLALRALLGGR